MNQLYYIYTKSSSIKHFYRTFISSIDEPVWFKLKNETENDLIFYKLDQYHINLADFYDGIKSDDDDNEDIEYDMDCDFHIKYQKIILKPGEKKKIYYGSPLYVNIYNELCQIKLPFSKVCFNKIVFKQKLNKKYIQKIEKENEKLKYGKYD
jgi:hypothetical protein